jgi:excisionase family DNA binding protein
MNEWMSLDCLSGRLDLPKKYLRRLADENKIPFVVVAGNRRRFNQSDVCDAIRRLTTQQRPRRTILLGGPRR